MSHDSGHSYPPHKRGSRRARKPWARRTPNAPQARTRSASAEEGQTRKRMVYGLYAVLLVEVLFALFCSPVFAIKREIVSGISTLPDGDASTLLQVTAIRPGTNWCSGALSSIEHRAAALPFVRAVTVKRTAFCEVTVHVDVREPVIIARINGIAYEVDKDAVPIRPARPDMRSRLPKLVDAHPWVVKLGRPLNDGTLIAMIDLLANWHDPSEVGIAKIEVDQSDNICLNMLDRVSVVLGQIDALTDKLARLHDIYKHAPDIGQKFAVINLTVPTAPAVRLRNAVPPASTLPDATGNTSPSDTQG